MTNHERADLIIKYIDKSNELFQCLDDISEALEKDRSNFDPFDLTLLATISCVQITLNSGLRMFEGVTHAMKAIREAEERKAMETRTKQGGPPN